MDRANHGNLSTDHPAHDAAGFLANAFDTGHQIGKITKLAEKLASPFHRGPKFQLIRVRGLDSKHLFSVNRSFSETLMRAGANLVSQRSLGAPIAKLHEDCFGSKYIL